MSTRRFPALAVTLLFTVLTSEAAAQADHLHCFKIKDTMTKSLYTADLVPGGGSFPTAVGCTITVPAKQLCIDVEKTNVAPTPPGGFPGAPSQKYLCYKVKCPKPELATSATDQFGTHNVTLKTSSMVCAPAPAVCGDTAGPGSSDIPCVCGDTVVTDTVLSAASDPVVGGACARNGLTLEAGVELDLAGNTIAGSGQGEGLTIPAGASASNGTVQAFATGLRIAGGSGQTSVEDLLVEDNTGDGVQVEVTDPVARVIIDQVEVRENGGHGVSALSAPGLSNLDDVAHRIEAADYGLVLQDSSFLGTLRIHGNAGDGIHLGSSSQPADLAAYVSSPVLYDNGGSGIVLEMEALPGADCGSSASQPGCSGATIAAATIYNNTGPGVTLRSGFLIPLYVSTGPVPIDFGLGFVQNLIFHNAMPDAGCVSPQTAPQILITGPVGLSDATCGAAAPGSECVALSDQDDLNNHCVNSATDCIVGWDLRGDVLEGCESGLRNAIFGYNISDASDITVGIHATGNSTADASNNEWANSTSTQNVTQGAGSLVRAEPSCGTRACPVIP
jgi:hypothetical protein